MSKQGKRISLNVFSDELKELFNLRSQVEEDRVIAEGDRVIAEDLRVIAETSRYDAEGLRVDAESSRATTFAGYDGRVTDVEGLVDSKVDKVTGKQLSTEDYTTDEKTKLTNIAVEANKTVIANVLTETVVGKALDATQGKAINDNLVAHKLDYVAHKEDYAADVGEINAQLAEITSTLTLENQEWSVV